MPIIFTVDSFSLKKWCATGATRTGCAVTSITELATDVNSREVIQNAKCAARINPIPAITINVDRGISRSSFRTFLLKTTNGKISRVVNNSRYNAIERDGASHDTIKMAANDADRTDMKSALSGLFIMSN